MTARSLTELRHLERATFVENLRLVGEHAPTLCANWTAADLAAHVVASERAWGLPMVPAYQLRRLLPGALVRKGLGALQSVGDRQLVRNKRHGWDWLLHRLSDGPPRPYELRSIAPIRYVEEWVHHEDVRRANGFGPRTSTTEDEHALWRAGLALTKMRELLPGRDAVELVLPDGRSHRLGARPTVRVQGRPGELILFLAGRTGVAAVDVTGQPDDIRHLYRHLTI